MSSESGSVVLPGRAANDWKLQSVKFVGSFGSVAAVSIVSLVLLPEDTDPEPLRNTVDGTRVIVPVSLKFANPLVLAV